MPKIRGKFAPFFEELGNDFRWLIELNDFEKFIYQLVLCTIYWNNGSAPDDARYYQRRYNLKARPHQIDHALTTIRQRFRKLIAKDKKLSLLNYKGYGNRVASPSSLEVEIEIEEEREREGHEPLAHFNYDEKFEELWGKYPSKDGKKEAIRHFKATVKNDDDFSRCSRGLENYLKHLALPQNSFKNPKNGKTWFNNWQDWENWQEPERVENGADRDKRILENLSKK